ncbi:hypothetical protein KY348_03850 [Candidatus Woesearchaeota archaeon]|nr:hypothetical protein [Candidatus Woesearchaeota archaeon]
MAYYQPDLPVSQVRAMRERGFDNNQIVQALQRNGYSSTQIFDALNQADLASGAPGASSVTPSVPPIDEPLPPAEGVPPPPPAAPQGAPAPGGAPAYDYSGYSGGGAGVGNEEVEELVESIIEEKWDELAKDINKIVEWKNDVEAKINKLEQRFESLKQEFDKLHQAIVSKIGDYDKNILAVGADVKAMEKVFSKVLPVFTENVSELSRITQSVKKKKS